MLSAGMDKTETAAVYRRMRGDGVDGEAEGGSELVMVLVTPEKVRGLVYRTIILSVVVE